MVLEPGGIIAWIVVGLIAGWLTGKVVRGGGYGVLRDIILGIVGAFIGRIVMSPFGVQGQVGFMGSIMIAGCLAAYGAVNGVSRRRRARRETEGAPHPVAPRAEGRGLGHRGVRDRPGWLSVGDRRAVSPRPLVGLAAESPCGVLSLDRAAAPPSRSRWTASPTSWATVERLGANAADGPSLAADRAAADAQSDSCGTQTPAQYLRCVARIAKEAGHAHALLRKGD